MHITRRRKAEARNDRSSFKRIWRLKKLEGDAKKAWDRKLSQMPHRGRKG